MLTVHTSPLDQPGTGDAGGLNVYVVETAKRLGRMGIDVEIFTRRTSAALAETVQLSPGVLVRHIEAGPYEGLAKDDLPGQLCAFAAGVMRHVARRPEGYYDLVHSHYWLSGQVGWLAADRWDVPLVHTMHTMARVKNVSLADGDRPDPPGREIGEEQVVRAAAVLVANTSSEKRELVQLYGADPAAVEIVAPGVDLDAFTPGDQKLARAAVSLPEDAEVVLFVGRLQPLKAPDVLLRAVAQLLQLDPERRRRLVVAVLGGPSGVGLETPRGLPQLARQLGIADVVQVVPPVDRTELVQWYRAADLLAVPSYSESFGLVAVEAEACGTPVVAADVGGLPDALGDSGRLLADHDPGQWARALAELLDDPGLRARLSARAVRRAEQFGWDRSVERLVEVYRRAVATDPAQPPAPVLLGTTPQAVMP